ncbi:MAG: hypothetical protein AVO33_03890 [delta proteobacterium ML8_F1]|nr:MAG: hypothetical protein AVO33_03890 [delta proteobacterium ML8_F1]
MRLLIEKMKAKDSVVVVGIDPVIQRFPTEMLENFPDTYGRLMAFGTEIIEGVFDLVPAVKFQSAYFEACGLEGMRALKDLIARAKDRGLFVINDVKRGDIGSTATAYAEAYLSRGADFEVDAITINPYLGDDSNEAFYRMASENDKGLFLLIKTSNPSSGQLQDLEFGGKTLYERVVEDLKANRFYGGNNGYSFIGAVVGATYPVQLHRLREALPRSVFLIPGYGAQGGGSEDIKAAFGPDGYGALVNSSRGIIYAYEKNPGGIRQAAREAVVAMNKDLNQWRRP